MRNAPGVLGLVLFVLIGAPSVARANPEPPQIDFRIHVRPYDPSQCASPINNCDDVVGHTEQTGDLEFDFYYNYPDEVCGPLQDLDMSIHWSDHWSFEGFEWCNQSDATFEDLPHGIHVIAHGDIADVGSFTFLGRARLQVDRYGEVGVYGGGDCFWVDGLAEAGVHCTYYNRSCHEFGGTGCGISLDPDTLRVLIPPGGAKIDTISVQPWDDSCDLNFSVDQSWLSYRYSMDRHVYLTTDATDLPPGLYEGHLKSTSGSQTCVEILLDTNFTPVEQTSWGHLKSIFR